MPIFFFARMFESKDAEAISIQIKQVPIKGYHVYKRKVPLGNAITPMCRKILASFEHSEIGSVGVPLNEVLLSALGLI